MRKNSLVLIFFVSFFSFLTCYDSACAVAVRSHVWLTPMGGSEPAEKLAVHSIENSLTPVRWKAGLGHYLCFLSYASTRLYQQSEILKKKVQKKKEEQVKCNPHFQRDESSRYWKTDKDEKSIVSRLNLIFGCFQFTRECALFVSLFDRFSLI